MFLSLFLFLVVGSSNVYVSGFTNFKHFCLKNNNNKLQKLNENGNGNGNPHYPYSNQYFEQYLKRLNSKNISTQHQSILGNNNTGNVHEYDYDDDDDYDYDDDDDEEDMYPTPIFILTPQRQRQLDPRLEPHTRRKNKYSTNDFTNSKNMNDNKKKEIRKFRSIR